MTRRHLLKSVLGAILGIGGLRLLLPEGQTAVSYLRDVLYTCVKGRGAASWPREILVSPAFYAQLQRELVPMYRKLGFTPNSTPSDPFLMFKALKVRMSPTLRGTDLAIL